MIFFHIRQKDSNRIKDEESRSPHSRIRQRGRQVSGDEGASEGAAQAGRQLREEHLQHHADAGVGDAIYLQRGATDGGTRTGSHVFTRCLQR